MNGQIGLIVAVAVFGVFCSPVPVQAEQHRPSWSTYLRTGPGEHYAVIDEVEHDTTVDVRGCNDRWCEVLSGNVLGYVDKDALTLPKGSGGSAAIGGPEGCFWAGQYSYREPAPTRFCETSPGK